MPKTEHRLTVGGDELTFRVASEESGGALAAFDVRIRPGGGPPVLHRHDPFELYRIDRGQLTFYIADDRGAVQRTTAGPGSVVAIPPGREHTIRNDSEADAEAFVLFSPGEAIERFVRDADALTAGGAPKTEAVLALAARHGIEMTRPIESS